MQKGLKCNDFEMFKIKDLTSVKPMLENELTKNEKRLKDKHSTRM